MHTKSEENKPVIQHLDDALGRGDTDALFASTHKGGSSGARSPGLAEYDLRRIHGFGNGSCSHVHDHPGIARFLAKLMVGDMY